MVTSSTVSGFPRGSCSSTEPADVILGWETSALAGALKDCDGGGDNGSVDICPRLTIVESGSCKKEGDSPDLPEPEVVSALFPLRSMA